MKLVGQAPVFTPINLVIESAAELEGLMNMARFVNNSRASSEHEKSALQLMDVISEFRIEQSRQ